MLRTNACEDANVWKAFQPKFDLTMDLVNDADFFERLLYLTCQDMIKELVVVAEFRHIFGCVKKEANNEVETDENFESAKVPIGIEGELEIFKRVEDTIRKQHPLFRIKIIPCSLKFLGPDHFTQIVEVACRRKDDIGGMITGFDLVCEEDAWCTLDQCLPAIYKAKAELGDKFQLYLHAGESCSRNNKELYDAVLLGTKRIGHGFALARHPALIDLVKKNDICVEVNPISNLVLKY